MLDAIENIALLFVLMALGVGLTWAVLAAFIRYLEFQND